jgi:hypothetical protein
MSQIPFVFTQIAQTRKNMVNVLDSLNTEQLNLIPAGFNNNIIWNFAHILSSAQALCYKVSGKPLRFDDPILGEFRKGSKPERAYTAKEIDWFKVVSVNSLSQLEKDYQSGIEDAISFLPLHEGLHLGYMMAQRKLILRG